MSNCQVITQGKTECKMCMHGSCSSPATRCHSMQGIHHFAGMRKPCSDGWGVTFQEIKLYSINKCYGDVKRFLATHQLIWLSKSEIDKL